MIKNEIHAYDQFLRTGKIKDYLGYCQVKTPSAGAAAQEAVKSSATHAGGHYPPPIQNGQS